LRHLYKSLIDFSESRESGDGIIAARVPWMATNYSPDSQGTSLQKTIFMKALHRIMGTAGIKSASLTQERRD